MRVEIAYRFAVILEQSVLHEFSEICKDTKKRFAVLGNTGEYRRRAFEKKA